MIPIGWSLSDLARSNHGEDGEDYDDEETEQGNLSDDNEPGWAMGTITKTVQQRMERFRQKQIKLDNWSRLGWENVADNFHERVRKYATSKLWVLAVVQLRTDDDAAVPAITTFRELMECLDIDPRILLIPQGLCRPGCSHNRLVSVKPQLNTSIPCIEPAVEPDFLPLLNVKPVEFVSIYLCI
jgi:hypothetical protein